MTWELAKCHKPVTALTARNRAILSFVFKFHMPWKTWTVSECLPADLANPFHGYLFHNSVWPLSRFHIRMCTRTCWLSRDEHGYLLQPMREYTVNFTSWYYVLSKDLKRATDLLPATSVAKEMCFETLIPVTNWVCQSAHPLPWWWESRDENAL